jgi:hypothetical protein
MHKFSKNWIYGGAAGGLRMATANVGRLTSDSFPPHLREQAIAILVQIYKLQNELADVVRSHHEQAKARKNG